MPTQLPGLIVVAGFTCGNLWLCDQVSRHYGWKNGWLKPQLVLLAATLAGVAFAFEAVERWWAMASVLVGAFAFFVVKVATPKVVAGRRRKAWTRIF